MWTKLMMILSVLILIGTTSVSAVHGIEAHYPQSDNIVIGSPGTGTLENVETLDQDSIVYNHITDTTDTLDVRFIFNETENIDTLEVNSRYSAPSSRRISLEVFDTVEGWVELEEFAPSSDFIYETYDVSGNSLEPQPRVRFRNYGSASDTDTIELDYMVLISGDTEQTDSMFDIDITIANVLILFLLITVSSVLIYTRKFGLVIAGGVILVLISSMIMFSFNAYIGLLLLLACVSVIFEFMGAK